MSRGSYNEKEIVSLMIGHSIEEKRSENITRDEIVYEVTDLQIDGRIKDFELKLYKGEILGIAGLMGSGKDELIKCLFGLWPARSKNVKYLGNAIKTNSPKNVMKKGIVYLPEERKLQSLFLDMTVRKNISAVWWFYKDMASESEASLGEKALAEKYIKKLSVKTPSDVQKIVNLSGGNQQKAVIGRLLAVSPKIMILNDPTRGIDVGSKEEIYDLIRELAKTGTSIVIVSSELEEICKLSNRVMVLSKGEVCGEFVDDDVTMDNILPCAVRMNQ